MSLEAWKKEIWERIKDEKDSEIISELVVVYNRLKEEQEMVWKMITSKPKQKTIDLKEVAEETNYKGFSPKELEQLRVELDIQEPIEELIASSKS